MPLKHLLLVAAMAATTFGAAMNSHDECGTTEVSADYLAAVREMQEEEAVAVKATVNQRPAANIIIPTYFHVVSTSKAKKDGYLTVRFARKSSFTRISSLTTYYTQEAETRQILDDINRGYANMGFQFAFKGVDYSTDPTWAQDQDEAGMKKALRKGDYKTLNLFYVPSYKYNGRCPFPSATADRALDGCTVRAGVALNGQTTTHEIGHWLGLMHTFETLGRPECDADNDRVDDTPAMKGGWSECSVDADTCPGLPGKDPVTNFMCYSTCRSEFTPGQKARAAAMYKKFRA
ncbi:hypothetical protein PWT90_00677 [Aphanocladium album]|nr:hypothetical protein PWT90_00677 [Aphanocladium album]